MRESERHFRGMRPIRTRNIVLYAVLLVAVLFSMAALWYCSSDREGEQARQSGERPADDTLRVAITYSPLSFYMDSEGKLSGLSYDMINLMAADMKRPVKFEPVVSLDGSLKKLADGDYDMLASVPLSMELRDKYLFTESVYLDRQVLVQHKDTGGVKSVLDLAGDTVHIERGSSSEERLSNLGEEIGAPIHVVAHSDLSDEYIFLKIVAGDIRYGVINEKTARQMGAKYPQIDVTTPVGFTQFQSWVTRRSDTALRDSINNWLVDFKQTPKYKELLKRYQE